MTHPAGDAERRDEDVEQHDEVQEVGGHVLPERHAPERHPLLSVLVLLLDEERVMLLRFGELLFGLRLLLLTQRGTQVLAGTGYFVVEVHITGTFLGRFLDHLYKPAPSCMHYTQSVVFASLIMYQSIIQSIKEFINIKTAQQNKEGKQKR